MLFVTEHDVLSVEVNGPNDFHRGRHVTCYDLEVKSWPSQQLLGQIRVILSHEVMAGIGHITAGTLDALLNVARPRLRQREFAAEIEVLTTNIAELTRKRVLTPEELRHEILKLLWRVFQEPSQMDVAKSDICRWTGFSTNDVSRALFYFERSGLVRGSEIGGESYKLQDGQFPTLETIIRNGPTTPVTPSGFFRRVELAAAFDTQYVYVLMSFREEKNPQSRYWDIIKPTLERSLGMYCWRADEHQDQARITDQIFSEILRAELVVADLTGLNPNVMLEVGLALSNHKKVYPYFDRTRGDIRPRLFDISDLNVRDYSDDEEYMVKLSEVRVR